MRPAHSCGVHYTGNEAGLWLLDRSGLIIINEDVIELKRFFSCNKSQITILPLDDVPELPFP